MSITTSFHIPIQRAYPSRLHEVDWDNLEFGKYFTDHMLICDFTEGQWQDPQIVPFGDFRLSPVSIALHYGQTIFEGMKAFRMDGPNVSGPSSGSTVLNGEPPVRPGAAALPCRCFFI